MRLIDFSARTIPPHEIKAAGYDGVVAYVSESRPGASFGAKPITREYADALRAEGLEIVSNFQYGKPGGSAPSDFTRGFDGGVADARTALRFHEAAGGPDSAPIIFSIDDDVDLDTWNTTAVEWFRGINSVLGVERTGIYGHSRVCAWAVEDGVVGRSTTFGHHWVWQTRAWSCGGREPTAVLYQDLIDTASNPGPLVGGTRVDVSETLAGDFGQWSVDRSVRRGATGRRVIAIQTRLNSAIGAGLLVDGEFGDLTQRAVSRFQEACGLTADGGVGEKTWAQLFADHRDAAGPRQVRPEGGAPRSAPSAEEGAGDPDRFPLPAGCYWGPLDGPEESWSNGAGSEPQSSRDGLRRWQKAVGIATSGTYDEVTKEAAARLQSLHGRRPVTGTVSAREWDEVIGHGWRLPTPEVPAPGTTMSPAGYRIDWYDGPGYSEGHGAYLRIYLHTTENQDWMTSAENVADYQGETRDDPDLAGSYHYLVDDDHIINTVATKDTAWGLKKDNPVSVQIAMVATSGEIGCWGCRTGSEENPNVEHRPKSREQWLAHGKMLDMVAFTIATVATEYDIPIEWLDTEAVGNNRRGVSSHCNYSYGSVLLHGKQDSTHWDVPDTFPHDVVLDAARRYVDIVKDPDRFPLPAGHYWGPLDGPAESWSNVYGGEPRSSIEGLTRWQEAIGITASGIYDYATKTAAGQLQEAQGWAVTGLVSEREWNEVFGNGWRPGRPRGLRAVTPPDINPGPPENWPRKIGDVTGPRGLTDQFGMAATDLGVMARTPRGRILAVFGDTFHDAQVGGGDWRAPVALFSDTKDLDAGIVWSEAAGEDPGYARQLWRYDHFRPATNTVLPSDVLTIGDAMYLHVSGHFPFGSVAFTEIWKSLDDGRSWFRIGDQLRDPGRHGGLANLWTWDIGDDGWVYVLSTAFTKPRDRPIILRRVRPEQIADWNAYEGWGFADGRWDWGREPTPVRGGGFGEMCLRRMEGQWVLVVFNNRAGSLDVKVFPDFENTDLSDDATWSSPIHRAPWGEEGNDAVAQMYGPSIVPGSRLHEGFHILLSQWHYIEGEPPQNNKWPYHVMQFKLPPPALCRGVDREAPSRTRDRRRSTQSGTDEARSRDASMTAGRRTVGSRASMRYEHN